ncbi:MAG: hypothetical protein R3F11_20005 [Verrucomicrobiales bacterium]
MLEDYGAAASKGKDFIAKARFLMPGALAKTLANPEVKQLWKLREALRDAQKWIGEADQADLEGWAFVLPEEAGQLASPQPEAAFEAAKTMVAEDYLRALAEFNGGSLPDPLKDRLRGGWFDLFRLAFRENLKTDSRARTAYYLDFLDSLAAALGQTRDDVEDGFERVDRRFDRLERQTKGIRSVLDDLRKKIDALPAGASAGAIQKSFAALGKRYEAKMAEIRSGIEDLKSGQKALRDGQKKIQIAVAADGHKTRASVDALKEELAKQRETPRSAAFNLPPQPFCAGRDREIAAVAAWLSDQGDARVAAVTGPPGVGKSTVLLRAAHADPVAAMFGGRRAWVRCEEAPDSELLRQRIAEAVGLTPDAAWAAIRDTVAAAPALVVPNFETALDGRRCRQGRDGAHRDEALGLPSPRPRQRGAQQALADGDRTLGVDPFGPRGPVPPREIFRHHAPMVMVAEATLDAFLAGELDGLPPRRSSLLARQAALSGSFVTLPAALGGGKDQDAEKRARQDQGNQPRRLAEPPRWNPCLWRRAASPPSSGCCPPGWAAKTSMPSAARTTRRQRCAPPGWRCPPPGASAPSPRSANTSPARSRPTPATARSASPISWPSPPKARSSAPQTGKKPPSA